jgi:hypothetical protein
MDTTEQQRDAAPSRGGIVDHRTRRARRRRELIAVYSNLLGGDAKLTDGQRVDVRKAAELVALAEDARAMALQDMPGSAGMLSAMVRLQSASERAIRALRLPEPKDARPQTSLADYLASKRAAAATDG